MKLFRWERLLLFAAISAGIALRLAEYLRNRSLWGDEVAIATNLRLRGFGGLLHLLSYNQTMPIGLLFVLKTFVSTLGHSELVLRLPALLAGCALIVLTWKLMGKVEEMPIVIVVVALMATSSLLIDYSAEVKQYGVDAVVALVILHLGMVTLKGEGPQAWRDLIVTGAIAMFFSQPIILYWQGLVLQPLSILAFVPHRCGGSGGTLRPPPGLSRLLFSIGFPIAKRRKADSCVRSGHRTSSKLEHPMFSAI
jgi:hypothetical protein